MSGYFTLDAEGYPAPYAVPLARCNVRFDGRTPITGSKPGNFSLAAGGSPAPGVKPLAVAPSVFGITSFTGVTEGPDVAHNDVRFARRAPITGFKPGNFSLVAGGSPAGGKPLAVRPSVFGVISFNGVAARPDVDSAVVGPAAPGLGLCQDSKRFLSAQFGGQLWSPQRRR